MKKISEPIVFFGSGPVAAASLELLAKDFSIEAVITKPQPPHHKEPFPVLALAGDLGLKIYTPNGRSEVSELFKNKPVMSRLGIVIDYGFIVNQDVIDYFPLGIINSHFSLLPKWRGADPISFAILNGDETTGVSLMLIVEQMDAGPLLAQATYKMPNAVTTPELTNSLVQVSHHLLCETLPKYLTDTLKPYPQVHDGVSYSRKLTKADGQVDWTKSAHEIEREVRAFIEWPKSHTRVADIDITIISAHIVDLTDTPGLARVVEKQLIIYCGKQALVIDSLKPSGKTEMSAQAFLAGYGQRI